MAKTSTSSSPTTAWSPTPATARSAGACRSDRSTTSTAWARRPSSWTISSSSSATRAPVPTSSPSTNASGAVRWKTARPEAHSGHSTPILYRPKGGGTQILVPGSFLLTAYDAKTGAKTWWVRGLSFELKSTPVVSGDTLFINGFGSPENQPGSQRTIPAYDEAIRSYDADKDTKLTRSELPKEHSRGWIDLDSDGVDHSR